MSRAAKLDTAPEKRKPKQSPRDNKPLSQSGPKSDESSLRAEKEAWVATPAPDFLIRPEPSHKKGEPAAASQAEDEPVTIQLMAEPARAPKHRRRWFASLASFVLYAALFIATALTSAAVVLFVL